MMFFRTGTLCFAVAVALLPNVAWPLILANPSDRNASRPLDDPGWDNVGERRNIEDGNSASAVYLGNRWVLTANHVKSGDVRFGDTVYEPEAGSDWQLRNVSTPPYLRLGPAADLLLYRLTADPGLPSLNIRETSVPYLSDVTMIGYGKTQQSEMKYWDLNWQEVNEPQKSVYRGFQNQNEVSAKRWGANRVVMDGTTRNADKGDTMGRRTVFDRVDPIPNEAQAASGDSGGAVFSKRGETWELAGIMLSISHIAGWGQPEPLQSSTTDFGYTTVFADLAPYRDQINSFVFGSTTASADLSGDRDQINSFATVAASQNADPADVNDNELVSPLDPLITATPWRNADPLNVNDDEVVSPLDALIVFNELNNRTVSDPDTSSLPLLGPSAEDEFFYDVNGDNYVTPLDALIVINRVNEAAGQAASVPAVALREMATLSVPEPSSFGLFACGLIWLAAATGGRKRFGRRHFRPTG
ncbi:MAG: hypothetical protein BMS9Abin04_402 [Planctomycetia bacterium]|nr:MAG: hypothetical protein BMS9Abin04_402 [Planctomycetia bacterium]